MPNLSTKQKAVKTIRNEIEKTAEFCKAQTREFRTK